MDSVFTALAHPTRRHMLDALRANPGRCVGELCERFEMSRIGAMKHLGILEQANLVVSESAGRKRLLYVNAVPIQMIYDRWLSDWSSMWASEVTAIKHRAEAATQSAASAQPSTEMTEAVRHDRR